MATHESHKLKDHQTVANESNMASSHQFLNGINSHSHLFLILPLIFVPTQTRYFLLVSLLISLLNTPDDFVKATQEGQFCEGVMSEEIVSMVGDSQLLVGVLEAVSARVDRVSN
jgi:hypothetical protein